MQYFLIVVSILAVSSCSSRKPFWSYLVEDDVAKPLQREEGTPDMPRLLSPYNVKVAYNDGSQRTEILIPILSQGQQIVIDNKRVKPAGLSVVTQPPTKADETIEDAYLKSGKPVNKKAEPVSIIKTLAKVQEYYKEGQYSLALQYVEQILARYPNHVQSLRAKGSLLLKMGERQAAYKVYLKAQEVEPSKKVEKIIQRIEER